LKRIYQGLPFSKVLKIQIFDEVAIVPAQNLGEAIFMLPLDPSFLVIRNANIGDLICTTPLISALRERFPNARIDALVNTYNCPVLLNNPDISHVYAFTKGKHRESHETLAGVHWRRLKLILALRRLQYDTVILANGGYLPRPLRLAHWIAPRSIIGFVPQHADRTGIDQGVTIDEQPRHEVENIFRLLKPLGIDVRPPPLRLVATIKDSQAARQRLSLEPWYDANTSFIVAIHISARKKPQRWPADRFAKLMRRLHSEFGCQFMLFWSPGDELNPRHPGDDRKAESIAAATSNLPVIAYPSHRLEDLIGGLSACRLMVCSDGGAMHVGAGLGLPIVSFFGNSDATKWHPWGVPYVLLQKTTRNVTDISVDEAVHAFGELYRSITSVP
jgi:ADP-heptose:LPS heptosyltransferase